MNRNRNTNNNNSRKLNSNESKRVNNNYKSINSKNTNNEHKSVHTFDYKSTNGSNVKKEENLVKHMANTENKTDNHHNQHMPGIPVKRSSSSPPFSCAANDCKTDETNALNNGLNHCVDGSGDKSGQQLDAVIGQISAIDLDNKEIKEKTDSHSQPNTDSQTKSDFGNNSEVNTNRRKNYNYMTRRNTTGSFDNNYRFNNSNKRFNRGFINSNNCPDRNCNNNENTSYQYNYDSHKYFRNYDRNNSQNTRKYESNDRNRGFRPKPFTTAPKPLPSSVTTTSGGDYGLNDYSFTAPNVYYYNPYDPYLQSMSYMMPNQYPIYSLTNQSIGYPIQQTMVSNSNESNTQMAINGNQTDKQSAQESDHFSTNGMIGTYNTAQQFIPFQPTVHMPYPPLYIGFIKSNLNENGLYSHYFISQFPPNMNPLPLDVDVNGAPLLPSNCKVNTLNIHQ